MSYATLRYDAAVRLFKSLQEDRQQCIVNMKQIQDRMVAIESEMRKATMEKYLLEKEIEDENQRAD